MAWSKQHADNFAFFDSNDYNTVNKKPIIKTTDIDAGRDNGFKNFEGTKTPTPAEDKEDNEEKQRNRKTKAKKICSRIISNLILVGVVLGYMFMGGFLFEYLEKSNEISACKEKQDLYSEKLSESSDRVYNLAQNPNSTFSEGEIYKEMHDFASAVYSLSLSPTVNCTTLGEADNLPYWNLINSIYFCATIITTIGYGHISPTTQWGQIVCIIYSILGIPIMLIFLGKIGEPMAVIFRSFYLNIFCCKCFLKDDKKKEEENAEKQLEWKKENVGGNDTEKGTERTPPEKITVVEDTSDEATENEEDNVNIPITVTLLVLTAYIMIGAMVFKIWEKEWTLVEATYFSFITLSTIGFGDYVPGRDGPFNDLQIQIELIIGSIYCIFGLALIAMCINLIQDEITNKFVWIGTKLKCNKKDQDSDNDESSDEESESEYETDSDEEESDTNTKTSSKKQLKIFGEVKKYREESNA